MPQLVHSYVLHVLEVFQLTPKLAPSGINPKPDKIRTHVIVGPTDMRFKLAPSL